MACVKRSMALQRTRCLTVAACVLAATAATGAPTSIAAAKPQPPTSLTDPMRPPAGNSAPAERTTPAALAALAGTPGIADAASVLQGTRRSEQGVWIALIDGRWRSVGERHGDAVVTAIATSEVQLSAGAQRLILKMPQARAVPARTDQDRP